jgi:transposase
VLTLTLPSRVLLCTVAVDMRKSFDGLSGLVQQYLAADPLSGDLFVFFGKRRDKVKLLWWTDDGYALYYKRLEAGTFAWPTSAQARGLVGASTQGVCGLTIRAAELALLLDGVELSSVRRRRRYQRPTTHAG